MTRIPPLKMFLHNEHINTFKTEKSAQIDHENTCSINLLKMIPTYDLPNYPELTNFVTCKDTQRIDFNNYDAYIYTDRSKIDNKTSSVFIIISSLHFIH